MPRSLRTRRWVSDSSVTNVVEAFFRPLSCGARRGYAGDARRGFAAHGQFGRRSPLAADPQRQLNRTAKQIVPGAIAPFRVPAEMADHGRVAQGLDPNRRTGLRPVSDGGPTCWPRCGGGIPVAQAQHGSLRHGVFGERDAERALDFRSIDPTYELCRRRIRARIDHQLVTAPFGAIEMAVGPDFEPQRDPQAAIAACPRGTRAAVKLLDRAVGTAPEHRPAAVEGQSPRVAVGQRGCVSEEGPSLAVVLADGRGLVVGRIEVSIAKTDLRDSARGGGSDVRHPLAGLAAIADDFPVVATGHVEVAALDTMPLPRARKPFLLRG